MQRWLGQSPDGVGDLPFTARYLQRAAYCLQPTAYSLQPSAFSLPPSAFRLQPTSRKGDGNLLPNPGIGRSDNSNSASMTGRGRAADEGGSRPRPAALSLGKSFGDSTAGARGGRNGVCGSSAVSYIHFLKSLQGMRPGRSGSRLAGNAAATGRVACGVRRLGGRGTWRPFGLRFALGTVRHIARGGSGRFLLAKTRK